MRSVKGRNVLITGASSGIGKALSEYFARLGAHLFLGCHPVEADILSGWAEKLEINYGIRTWTFPIDLAADHGPDNLWQATRNTGQIIHVLVNNAGIIAYGDFHTLSLEKQEKIIRINLMAYLRLMHLFVCEMVAKGEGMILNVSSVSAFQPCAHHSVYGASKAFIQSLSEAINQELKGTGVCVSTINPSFTNTPMLKGKDFPGRLWWFSISGLSSPEVIARKGVKAFLKGKSVYIPGARNWFIHCVLLRFVPRSLAGPISSRVLSVREH